MAALHPHPGKRTKLGFPMGIQSITAKSKHKWDCTCRGTSGYAAAEVALKLTIYSLHVWGEKNS